MQYLVEAGKQVVGLEVEQLEAGTGFKVVGDEGRALGRIGGLAPCKYDLLGEIAEKTQLTRRTCAAILTGINPGTFAKFKQNPEQFITEAARLINEQKATVIVEHLDLRPARRPLRLLDLHREPDRPGPVEGGRQAEEERLRVRRHRLQGRAVVRRPKLDVSDEVVVYSKLPRGFFIPTPVGDYNPDWAIAFREGTRIKHVYFVAETKGSLSTLQLKGVENAKIECARKFFASLNDKAEHDGVKYDVVTDYDTLLQLVAG